MGIFKKAAASTAVAGLLAFGAVVGSGGSALAGTGESVTACSAFTGTLALGLQPNCTAGDSTIDNPTSLTISLNTSALGSLLNVIPDEGLKATWALSCIVNGATVNAPAGSYTVTTAEQSASTTIDLQTAVGSPEPNQCTVSDLTVTTTLALTLGALGLNAFSIGVNATADTAVPGAIWQSDGSTSAGAHAVVCADDTGNGNAGTKIQSWQCLSDLADYFVQTSSGQLVHNGDCLDVSGSSVVLASCTADDASQQWSQSTPGGTVQNQSTGTCLTAPSPRDGAGLTVSSCANRADQQWTIPS